MTTDSDTRPSSLTSKRLFGAGMLAAGMVAGAMFAPIGLASAQDDADTDDSTEAAPGGERREHRQHRGEALESLGIDAETVRAGFDADKSLATIAGENAVTEAALTAAIEADMESHIADAVENGRLTQEEADEKLAGLTDTITERVNTVPSERPEREGRGRGGRFHGGEVLDELGLTTEDLQAGREAGQTLAETAAANGVSQDALVDALVASATERAEAATEAGRIDEDRAAEMLDGLEDKIVERVNAEPGDRPERPGRGQRAGRGAPADEVEGSSLGF